MFLSYSNFKNFCNFELTSCYYYLLTFICCVRRPIWWFFLFAKCVLKYLKEFIPFVNLHFFSSCIEKVYLNAKKIKKVDLGIGIQRFKAKATKIGEINFIFGSLLNKFRFCGLLSPTYRCSCSRSVRWKKEKK